ncbi:MAG: hypothetical protein KC713_08525 [Candidatus Omnitrophica bacterium]|nr:hypothetical protein [Candidatus Omnitrophota bacterium]
MKNNIIIFLSILFCSFSIYAQSPRLKLNVGFGYPSKFHFTPEVFLLKQGGTTQQKSNRVFLSAVGSFEVYRIRTHGLILGGRVYYQPWENQKAPIIFAEMLYNSLLGGDYHVDQNNQVSTYKIGNGSSNVASIGIDWAKWYPAESEGKADIWAGLQLRIGYQFRSSNPEVSLIEGSRITSVEEFIQINVGNAIRGSVAISIGL